MRRGSALNPLDLIDTARRLTWREKGKPRQTDLRRALSTAYYAGFHALAKSCADSLVGASKTQRSEPAWRQTYRALEHGFSKNACKDGAIISRFPAEIQDFASCFVALQEKRHAADYDPSSRYAKSEVDNDISAMNDAIRRFQDAPMRDRRAFSAHVLLKKRP